jgi:putative transposase
MNDGTTVSFPGTEVVDGLSELLRSGARRLIHEAVEAELEIFLEQHRERHDAAGRQAVVRNGYLPEREVLTGVGPVTVKVPRVRDRSGQGAVFHSALLPPYLRKSKSVEAVLPWLYLKGISTGEFDEALSALFGGTVAGLSASTISRLKTVWEDEYQSWQRKTLDTKRFVYLWADGVHLNVRMEESKQCVLVVIGVDEHGFKHFLAIEDGYRESTQSWREVLQGLKSRGMNVAPQLAVGDGALGFWAALGEVFPNTGQQRCWVHKTANILNKLPKATQPKAKEALQQVWMAASRADAERAYDRFVSSYQDKYPKAVETLRKDHDELLAFYDFPAKHWAHIRTTNPIESSFATVRHRTRKTKNCLSRKTGLAMVYKLAMSAQKGWRRLRGFRQLADVIEGVKFIDGMDSRTINQGRTAA